MDELLITPTELAKLLRVSPSGFWRLKKAGKLPPCVRIGRRDRYRLEDVTSFLAQGLSEGGKR